MKKPLVSVIIPTYKSRGGLKKSIDSVLSQTYSNIEVIVIDDNNPGTEERIKTEDLMNEYSLNSQVTYLKHEYNKNGAAARNTGIFYSSGDYIAFLDDDDEWFSSKIEKQVNFLLANPRFDSAYTRFVSHDVVPYVVPYEGDAIIPLLMGRTRMYTSTLLLTRAAVLSINGFDESFRRHQDYEFLIRFFDKGYKIGYMDEVLVRYTPLGGNSPQGKDYELLKDKYLNTFSDSIARIDYRYPGKGLQIVVSNYALVFYAHLASGLIKEAMDIYFKYFVKAPIPFISQILFMLKSKALSKRYADNN